MQAIRNLLPLLRRLNKVIMGGILLVLLVGLGYAVWDFYQTAPRSLFTLDEQLLADSRIQKAIGEKTGTAYTYSDHALAEGDSAMFTCTITGRCDSSYVKISGYYFNRNNHLIGVATDTIIKAMCL